jgi:transketolase
MRFANEPVILSNGHAGLALYTVLESVVGIDAEILLDRHGTHPNRSEADGIYASTGSLGIGLPIALGMAIADRDRRVFCVISDGECAEGSVWESLAVKTKYGVENLNIFANANGFSSYDAVNRDLLAKRLHAFDPGVCVRFTRCDIPFAKGYEAHYHVLSAEQRDWLLNHVEEFV